MPLSNLWIILGWNLKILSRYETPLKLLEGWRIEKYFFSLGLSFFEILERDLSFKGELIN